MRPTVIDVEPLARSYSVRHPPGTVTLPQPPGWDQLLLTAGGAMRVETTAGVWVVPPGRAVWVPDGVDHRLVMWGPVRVRGLYLRAELPTGVDGCRAVNVSPVLREVALHAIATAPLWDDVPAHVRLVGVVLDLLEALPTAPLQLPRPVDPRAVEVADRLVADPADGATVDALAAAVGASRRTLERAFVRDTAMTVGQWRQRARLQAALGLLAEGRPVTEVALAVGYATPSAFTAMFRQVMGTSPSRYRSD